MFNNILKLLEDKGPFVVVPMVFVVMGFFMLARAVWGLLTGGPRAMEAPGAPHLYDRLYLLLNLIMLIGWTGFAVCFLASTSGGLIGSSMTMMMSWAICGIGIGLMFLLRGDMMVDAQRYLARHGFYLWRWGRALQVARLEQQPAWMRKGGAGLFIAIGMVILGVCVARFPTLVQDMNATVDAIVHIF